jgi:hypothetical protein
MIRQYEFRALNASKGFHWFSPDAMRFFKTRILHKTWDVISGYFITSETGPCGGERRYTLRRANAETGNVNTIGEFQAYSTIAQAKGALRRAQRAKLIG